MSPYYVCTIPFSQFLEWKFPTAFVETVLNGGILVDRSDDAHIYDEFLLKNWINDVNNQNNPEVVLLEMRARISRFAYNNLSKKLDEQFLLQEKEISQVEKIAMYIAQNFQSHIKVSDIGKAVGLHPDYANSIFKKSFGCTLSEYIIEERISHTQRKLITTDLSITEIAYACGFNSISSFNAAFLKINGCTPRQFRKGIGKK
jgi:AraC-like DNA-binding protein